MKSSDEILEFDRQHVWHPYTSMINPLPTYLVASADGVEISLEDGRKLIDGMSSWWCAVHGYNNPSLNRAAEEQLKKMSHVMFGGLTHRPAVDLCEKLINIAPEGLDRVFFCDSGSVAVEVAVKMALQFMQAKLETKRKNKIATIRGGYHGDTWHAMSVCDPEGGMHSLYTGRLPIQFFAPKPEIAFNGEWSDEAFEPIRTMIENNHEQIAAFIIEPIVQGAGGMWFYHPEYLRKLRKLCDTYNILLIADEIATGFGRTGKMFACEWAEISPDIMAVGKALTGGYMSFAAVLASGNVADTISSGTPSEFMHGPTFMGNPLACAVANASLELLCKPEALKKVAQIGAWLTEMLAPAKELNSVADVRIIGTIGVVEVKESVNMAEMQRQFVASGVWIRPFGRLVYIMPPYIITKEQTQKLCSALIESIKH